MTTTGVVLLNIVAVLGGASVMIHLKKRKPRMVRPLLYCVFAAVMFLLVKNLVL